MATQTQTAVSVATEIERQLEREDVRAQLEKAAYDGLDVGRLIANVRAAVAASPKLQACTVPSILRAASMAARAGLQIGVAGEAYLVAFKTECQFIAGYRGKIKIAYDGGAVSAIEAHLVREGDKYRHWIDDTGAHVEFEPMPFGSLDRKVLGAFAYAILSSGAILVEPMSETEILAIKARSPAVKAGVSTPWDTDPGEMYRKCPIHRITKRCPMSDRSRERMAITDEDDTIIDGDAASSAAAGARNAFRRHAAALAPQTPADAHTPAPALPSYGPGLSALLDLVDVPLDVLAVLMDREDADVGRHHDAVMILESDAERLAYVRKIAGLS